MEDGNAQKLEKPNLRGDILNIILLTFLYVLQGIPYGLTLALPLILQNRNATLADQAEFSFVSYSYCVKLLWAPIVDCIYSKKIGRRKTWLIPTQYLIGILLFFISTNVEDWLGSEDGTRKPNVRMLLITFFLCNFFSSTQDIAVDGWSLTMLKKRNVGHAGTCYNIGYAIGQFSAYVLFIILDSKDFCNVFRSVPQDKGFISFPDFILFWSIVFISSTTLILIFKRDGSLDNIKNSEECRLGLKESYKKLWVIFGPVQGVTPLKLMDAGIPRDKYVLFTVPSLPFQFILPFLLSNQLTGPKSMHSFLIAYVLKLIVGGVFAASVFFISYFKEESGALPTWYYWILLSVYNIDNLTMYVMWIAATAFFSRVSDPRFGGMYLTLLNTVTNIGYYWPVSTCLWLLDTLTLKFCSEDEVREMGTCKTIFDGFYVEVMICTVIGALWLWWGTKYISKLQKADLSSWTVKMKQINEKEKQSLTSSQVTAAG